MLMYVWMAFGLAMDTCALAMASGVIIKKVQAHHALKIGFFFGGFQMLMPLFGWMTGLLFRDYITAYDHWIAFVLLTVIGGKMIYESFQLKAQEAKRDPLYLPVLLLLSIATSIDAYAVGITFAFLKVSLIAPLIIIGLVTFSLSFLGVYIGERVGHLFENKLECVGGLILIALGIKIVIEHIF